MNIRNAPGIGGPDVDYREEEIRERAHDLMDLHPDWSEDKAFRTAAIEVDLRDAMGEDE